MICTMYKNRLAVTGSPVVSTWGEFTAALVAPHRVGAKDGPAMILGAVEGARSRSKVKETWAVGADVDDVTPEEIDGLFEFLEGMAYVAYTTHSHTPETPRWRFVFPLTAPVDAPAKVDHGMHAALNTLLPVKIDPACKDCSRLYYLPATPGGDAEALSVIGEGETWSFDVEPVEKAPPKALKKGSATLDSLCAWLQRRPQGPLKEATRALLKGEPVAPNGDHHDTLLRLAGLVARFSPDLDETVIEDLFADALDGKDHTVEHVWRAYEGAIELQQAEDEADRAQVEEERAARQAGDDGPYTVADLERIADVNGWEIGDLRERWILQRGRTYWILSETGDYIGAWQTEDAPTAAKRLLARAPVKLIEVDENGKARTRPWGEILHDHGTAYAAEALDLTIHRHRLELDPKGQPFFRQAAIPRRPMTPRFDPEIDRWIALAYGKHADVVRDWISICPDLSRPLCILYNQGVTGSGKDLLATGLARLWTENAPTNLDSVVGNFSESVLACPLVFGNEEVRTPYGSKTITAKLRAIISMRVHNVSRKGLKDVNLFGCLRIVLAANHDKLLESNNATSRADIDAVAKRILHVVLDDRAPQYLIDLGPDKPNQWADNGIARHALALMESRQVPHTRFGVEGDVAGLRTTLLYSTAPANLVAEWIVGYLTAPESTRTRVTRGGDIMIKDGQVWLRSRAITLSWSEFLPHVKDPLHTAVIGRTLSGLTDREVAAGRSFRVVDSDALFDWARRNDADQDLMARTLLPAHDKSGKVAS